MNRNSETFRENTKVLAPSGSGPEDFSTGGIEEDSGAQPAVPGFRVLGFFWV